MDSSDYVPFETIQKLYDEGRSVVSIAEELGVSKQTVYERMRRRGMEYRSRKQEPKISKAELEDLYIAESLTISEISRRIGHPRSSVISAIDQYGIKIRNNRLQPPRSEIGSLGIGEQLEITTDGQSPYYVYHDAKKLKIRVVIRRISDNSFAVIRTPLLTADRVKAFRDTGMSVTEIAFIYRADEKTIRRCLSELGSKSGRSA